MLLRREAIARGRPGHAETGVVRSDETALPAQLLDDIAVHVRPGGVSVQQEDDRARSLVEVVHIAVVGKRQPVIFKGIFGGVYFEGAVQLASLPGVNLQAFTNQFISMYA